MSTNILRKYAGIFAFRYLCLLPNRQFFISTRWHVVLFLALSLASFPSQNLVSYFQSSISYFLKVMYSFFPKQLNKFIFKCLINLGILTPLTTYELVLRSCCYGWMAAKTGLRQTFQRNTNFNSGSRLLFRTVMNMMTVKINTKVVHLFCLFGSSISFSTYI